MSNFFDIQMERKLNPDDYTQSISNPLKRMMIEDLFVCADKIIEVARGDKIPRPDKPIIRINPTNDIIAESMDGLIEISNGFINLCLASQAAPLHALIPHSKDHPEIPSTTPNALFSWTIAHEYWHGIRRHNTILDVTPNTNQKLRALEIDADLCAAASLYRWAQIEMSQNYPDIKIRMIILSSLFWAIRGMPESKAESTHPCNMERIYHICGKLTQLRANKNDPPDQSLSTEESRRNAKPLIETLIKAENLYKLINPETPESMIQFIKKFTDQNDWKNFTESWEEIRTLVSVTSGTNA